MESGAHPTDARRRPGLSVAAIAPVLPGFVVLGLCMLWGWHDGGFDLDTWYWGALVALALLVTVLAGPLRREIRLDRATWVALGAFALYVAWSYLSISWAQAPGTALDGSNKALLYLLIFALMALLPWTRAQVRVAALAFTLAIGTMAIVMLFRIAAESDYGIIFQDGRLFSPTGYFNSSAALFTTGALMAMLFATQRGLGGQLRGMAAGPVRGLLITMACAELQLALLAQSRGWLFTLPLVAIATFAVAPDRLRLTGALVLPAIAVLLPRHVLLAPYDAASGAAFNHAAGHAGRVSLAICGVMFVIATVTAWTDGLQRGPSLTPLARRNVGLGLVAVVLVLCGAGALAVTHNHPVRFIENEWHGFAHEETSYNSGSHFLTPGSGRYDFWRVALDAFLAHPVGGLGQDNFADYYILHRRTGEEPSWTHSLELRLLAHTGIVGFALFVTFMIAALLVALRARRRGDWLERTAFAAAMVPLIDWLIHGSVDWFWEIPALSGPALGFLGMAVALGRPRFAFSVTMPRTGTEHELAQPGRRWRRPAGLTIGSCALIAAVAALAFPYLSVREVSTASNIGATNPGAALSDLKLAGELDPLSSEPGRLGGIIAIEAGLFNEAAQRFQQAIDRERGGWYGWFGEGLAQSALGNTAAAAHDLTVAVHIEDQQPVIREALDRVRSTHPMSPRSAIAGITLIQ
jgi:O-Antigen ligase